MPIAERADEMAAAARLASAQTVSKPIGVVDLMYDAGGGTSIYETSRLKRCFQDVHMVSHHLLVMPGHL
jgi:hypothetical protein